VSTLSIGTIYTPTNFSSGNNGRFNYNGGGAVCAQSGALDFLWIYVNDWASATQIRVAVYNNANPDVAIDYADFTSSQGTGWISRPVTNAATVTAGQTYYLGYTQNNYVDTGHDGTAWSLNFVTATHPTLPSVINDGAESGDNTGNRAIYATVADAAPVLTSGTPTGTVGANATVGFTSTASSGTARIVIDTAANLDAVTNTQVAAGQKENGTAAAYDSGNITVTDTTPEFAFTGLAPGNWTACAVHDGSTVLSWTFVVANAGSGALQAQAATVSGTATVTSVDVSASGALQAQAAAVSGVAVDFQVVTGSGIVTDNTSLFFNLNFTPVDGDKVGIPRNWLGSAIGLSADGRFTVTPALPDETVIPRISYDASTTTWYQDNVTLADNGSLTIYASGALQAQAAAVAGVAFVPGMITASGALQALAAVVAGSASIVIPIPPATGDQSRGHYRYQGMGTFRGRSFS
jgi:hypothetical protein